MDRKCFDTKYYILLNLFFIYVIILYFDQYSGTPANQIKSLISKHRRSALPEYQLLQHCWDLLAHKVYFALHWLYHPVKFVTGHDHVDGYLTRNVYGLGFLLYYCWRYQYLISVKSITLSIHHHVA